MVRRSKGSIIPSTLALAIILSFVVYLLVLIFTSQNVEGIYPLQLLNYYQKGFWDLLAFAMQMMLILVLGNVLALTPIFQKLIRVILSKINNGTIAILLTAIFSLLLSYFNWGLGLIFSALLARSIAERARQASMSLNYPLLVAAAYSGMMVWHGGLSGSAPLTVAESNHFLTGLMGVIPVSETIFSSMNITLYAAFLVLIPSTFLLLSRIKANNFTDQLDLPEAAPILPSQSRRQYLGFALGIVIAFISVYQFYLYGLSALNINLINFILLSLGLILYANIEQFMKAVTSAISSSN
ncbi:MAG: hypothetical protein CL661_00230 [Bacteroidetes bacterium]|nr:hypothetical protein [Bacteroidota bacterium]